MPAAKQRRISEETRAVYVPLAERLGIHIWKREFEELCCRYLNGYAYDLAVRHNEQTAEARGRGLRYIRQYFSTLIMDKMEEGAIQKVEMDEEPLHTQLRRWATHSSSAPPAPVPRMRVIARDRETCWSCLGQIHRLLPPMPGRLRDYISSPKDRTCT
ncbi:unnamed protein product [Prorocentrum cordatum]|uniref:Uncharacterized protein n=1 Tax=Prorocentrum cordatum TaxID=2364126 RepID=A0ABN9W803_9DINO|nr:unnamed protein product [Polarella glacialis]